MWKTQYDEESLKTRQADSFIPLGYSFFIKWVILFIMKLEGTLETTESKHPILQTEQLRHRTGICTR